MQKIGLIDCDHKSGGFPNLALMKISAFFKRSGCNVEWYTPFEHYDAVYISRVFSFSPDYDLHVNADVVFRGGSGYAIQIRNGREIYNKELDKPLPPEIENVCPDYSLYGITDTAYGFITRGCPRACAFCHVARKEGTQTHMCGKLTDFWHGEKNIVLLDPNLLAVGRKRFSILRELANTNAWVDLNQGIDARLLTPAVCRALSKVKMKSVHFAWDRYKDGEAILPKLKMFARYNYKGKNKDHNAIVYVLVNFDSTKEQDLERVYKLRELGFWAYIMIYDKPHADAWYTDLQRWCNNRFVFAKCPRFEDYCKPLTKIELCKQILLEL